MVLNGLGADYARVGAARSSEAPKGFNLWSGAPDFSPASWSGVASAEHQVGFYIDGENGADTPGCCQISQWV